MQIRQVLAGFLLTYEYGQGILLLLCCLLLSNCIVLAISILFRVVWSHRMLFSCISVRIQCDTYNSISCVIDYACHLVMSSFPHIAVIAWFPDRFYHNMMEFCQVLIAKALRYPRSNRGFSNTKRAEIFSALFSFDESSWMLARSANWPIKKMRFASFFVSYFFLRQICQSLVTRSVSGRTKSSSGLSSSWSVSSSNAISPCFFFSRRSISSR